MASLKLILVAATASLASALLAGCALRSAAQPDPPPPWPPLAEGWQHGVFMEIFVRAWKDSDGDGIGDLRGLTQTLPYLQALGVRGLWLMPITPNADGDHGYATTSYRGIAPEYGTLADFDELVREARARGIGIVIDYVVNHSAAAHPYFVSARRGPGSPYRDWYVWSETLPAGWDIWGKNPWYHVAAAPWNFAGHPRDLPAPPPGARDFYFGTFGPHMPDFDLRNETVVRYHLDNLRWWMDRGLAGFRLDAVPHLVENGAQAWNDQPESRALARRMQDLVKSYPGGHVVCEATAEAEAWGDPAVCGGAFAFAVSRHYAKAALGDADSVRAVVDYFRRAAPTMATFVSNHDLFAGRRLWDQVGGDETAYRLAAAAYLLQPGTPFVYYGEEVGQAGDHRLAGDLPLRGPMSWSADARTAGFTTGVPFRPPAPNVATHNVAAQLHDPGSLLAFYRELIALRHARASLARGGYEHAFAQGLVAGWQRVLGDERTLVLFNYGGTPVTLSPPGLAAGARLRRLYPRDATPAAAGAGTVTLPPRSVQVLAVR